MPSMPRWMRTFSAGIQLDVRRGLHLRRVVAVEAEREDDRGDEDHAGHGHAVAQHGLVGVLALQPGRGGEQGRDGADERADDDERQKELHHGLADIDHGSGPRGDVGKDDHGDRQDDVSRRAAR